MGFFKKSKKYEGQEMVQYSQKREAEYPSTHGKEHATPTLEKEYLEYSERTREAKRSIAAYKKEWKKQNQGRKPGKLYPIEHLSERQHGALATPAAEAAMDSYTNARQRDNFLIEHPYGYRDVKQYNRHVGFVDKAFSQAEDYHTRFHAHKEGSSSRQ